LEILLAIQKIVNNHEKYKSNAMKLHDEFRFELYHKELSERLDAAFARK